MNVNRRALLSFAAVLIWLALVTAFAVNAPPSSAHDSVTARASTNLPKYTRDGKLSLPADYRLPPGLLDDFFPALRT